MHCAPCLTPFWKGECRRDVKSEEKKKKKAHVGIKSKTEKKDELLGEKVQRNKKGNTVGALRIHLCAHEKRIMGGKEKKYKVSLFLCMEICLGAQPTETLKPGAEANARMVDIHSSVKLIIIDEKRAFSFQRYSNEPFISK